TCDLAGASISSAKLHIKWASIAISGDASFLFKYRAIDDSEGTDQATFQETFTAQTQTVDGTSKDMNELEITLTNFSSNAVDADHIEFEFGRDGDSSDTLADEAVIFDCYIEVTTS
ncbi:MAG: hypothetical protein JSW07_06880, partial [bacterium]